MMPKKSTIAANTSAPPNQQKEHMKTIKTNLIPICLLTVALLQTDRSIAQPVTKVVASGNQTFFLKSGGSLWVMGLNDHGQLGNNTLNATNRPQKILATNVTAIAAGI